MNGRMCEQGQMWRPLTRKISGRILYGPYELIANVSVFILLCIYTCKKFFVLPLLSLYCQCLSKYSYQSIYCLKGGPLFWWEHAHDQIGTQSPSDPLKIETMGQFEGVGGGLRRQNFQKISSHPTFSYIIVDYRILPALKKKGKKNGVKLPFLAVFFNLCTPPNDIDEDASSCYIHNCY